MFRSLRISHVEFRFPGSEKLGPSRNGRMERNFPVIPIFWNFRPTSRGTSKISQWNSGKCLFHSLPNPGFPEFLVEWRAPRSIPSYLRNEISRAKTQRGDVHPVKCLKQQIDRPLISMHKIKLNNGGRKQMKISDFRLRVDFRTLLTTHLRMIHKPGVINQQH